MLGGCCRKRRRRRSQSVRQSVAASPAVLVESLQLHSAHGGRSHCHLRHHRITVSLEWHSVIASSNHHYHHPIVAAAIVLRLSVVVVSFVITVRVSSFAAARHQVESLAATVTDSARPSGVCPICCHLCRGVDSQRCFLHSLTALTIMADTYQQVQKATTDDLKEPSSFVLKALARQTSATAPHLVYFSLCDAMRCRVL
jgi:hypothetical protein